MSKLFIADDTKKILDLLVIHLGLEGYKEIITASSVSEALGKVEEIKQAGVRVAILDGNLDTNRGGQDGERIAQELREKIPSIKIISFSLDNITWGDRNVMKADAVGLLKAIKELE
jgi:DNA-binding response OmpR family regulator